MNVSFTGHHLEVTPAIRDYVNSKLDRITRHFESVITVKVTLSVEKLVHKVEVNVHMRNKDIHVEALDADMYAAIDAMADKLDRQIIKHKEKTGNHHRQDGGLKEEEAAVAE